MKSLCLVIFVLSALLGIPGISAGPDDVYLEPTPPPSNAPSVDEAFLKDLDPEARELYLNILNSRRPTLTCICRSEEPLESVCGADGVKYISECAATCRRVEVKCQGSCPCKEKRKKGKKGRKGKGSLEE